MTTEATRATEATEARQWPIGAFFLTWTEAREIRYQGRVVAFDGATVWGELYSWLDGAPNGILPMPLDPESMSFYVSDKEMRLASFNYNRYRHHYIGTFEENEITWDGKPPKVISWTAPLPEGFAP